jgi:poly-gamma-glutamate system protein
MTAPAIWPQPRTHAGVAPAWLAAAAALSLAAWLTIEHTLRAPLHPRYVEMLAAAHTVQAASRVLWAEKEARNLLPALEADPNRTGMIGPEFTALTTTLGELGAKRTTTNPDFAAALTRMVASLDLPRGTPVVIVLSGSFVGGNVAAIAAAETLGLRPVVVASLSASMWGAGDPTFNWLDIAAVLRLRGVIRSHTTAAVLGGDGAVGGSMDPQGILALRAAAERDGVTIVEARPLAALIDALMTRIAADIGGNARPGAVINVGGALIGLGSCREAAELAPGLTRHQLPCSDGTPGLATRLSRDGLPVLHVLNIRRLALELGLPFDPMPLPGPGNNAAVYGSGRGR